MFEKNICIHYAEVDITLIFAENEKSIRRKLCDLKGNSRGQLRHVFIYRMQILNDSFCNAMTRSQSHQDSKLLSQLC